MAFTLVCSGSEFVITEHKILSRDNDNGKGVALVDLDRMLPPSTLEAVLKNSHGEQMNVFVEWAPSNRVTILFSHYEPFRWALRKKVRPPERSGGLTRVHRAPCLVVHLPA